MNTKDEVHASKVLAEVWQWKEKAYEAIRHLTVEELKAHYEENRKKLAWLLDATVTRLDNGAYRFTKRKIEVIKIIYCFDYRQSS